MTAKKFDKAAHIASLIGNGWVEEDRAELEKTPDSILQKLQPVKPEPPKKVGNEKEETPEPVKAPVNNAQTEPAAVVQPPVKKLAWNELMDQCDEQTKDMLRQQASSYQREKDALIGVITDNGKSEIFTADDLKGYNMDRLRQLAAFAKSKQAPVENADTNNQTTKPLFGLVGDPFTTNLIGNQVPDTIKPLPDPDPFAKAPVSK